MIARMIHIEMGADNKIDIVGTQAEFGKMLKDIFLILRRWGFWRRCVIRRQPAVDENVGAVAHLNKVASHGCWSWRRRGEGGGGELHQVESLWHCIAC